MTRARIDRTCRVYCDGQPASEQPMQRLACRSECAPLQQGQRCNLRHDLGELGLGEPWI